MYASKSEWIDLRDSRQPNKTLDRSGVQYERILQLKRSWSSAKGVVTKRQNELLKLMKDSNNVDQVRAKVLELELALRNFYEAHDKYHAVLTDDSDIEVSIEYFRSVKHMGTAVIKAFDTWLKSVELKFQDELDLVKILSVILVLLIQMFLWLLEGLSLNLSVVRVSHGQAQP